MEKTLCNSVGNILIISIIFEPIFIKTKKLCNSASPETLRETNVTKEKLCEKQTQQKKTRQLWQNDNLKQSQPPKKLKRRK